MGTFAREQPGDVTFVQPRVSGDGCLRLAKSCTVAPQQPTEGCRGYFARPNSTCGHWSPPSKKNVKADLTVLDYNTLRPDHTIRRVACAAMPARQDDQQPAGQARTSR